MVKIFAVAAGSGQMPAAATHAEAACAAWAAETGAKIVSATVSMAPTCFVLTVVYRDKKIV